MQEEEIEYQPEYSIASEALIRIEKAKLYELLLRNELFGDDAGDADAVQQVTDEIKEFVLARLETLIGMRSGNESVSTPSKLPWNQQQIAVLTQLADRVLSKENQPIVNTPPKPSVNTINRQPPRQNTVQTKPTEAKPVQAPVAPKQKQPVRPTTGKPLIGSSKPGSNTPSGPTQTKAGDTRAYPKPIDNPLRRPMPSALEMHSHALAQVTSGMDFVSHGGTPEDSQKVGRILLGGMSANIETVQQGVD